MSRRWHVCGLAAGFAVLALAGPAQARQTEPQPTNEQLMQRIEEIAAALPAAKEAAIEAGRARLNGPRLPDRVAVDTFSVGPLTVVALPDQHDEAVDILSEALASYGPWVSEGRLLSQAMSFQWSVDLKVIDMYSGAIRLEQSRLRKTRGQMVNDARRGIGSRLGQELQGYSPKISNWFSGPVGEPADANLTYRILAAYPAAINQRCMRDGGLACWTAMGLDVDDFPMDDWYSPEQRQQLVAGQAWAHRKRAASLGVAQALSACENDGSVEDCDRVLESGLMGRMWLPLSNDEHTSLLFLALQAGGEGAWDRLTADPEATPSEALRAASGLTAEELGNLWHAWVLQQRGESQAGLGTRSLWALFWILAFAGMAMRSTRWRLG